MNLSDWQTRHPTGIMCGGCKVTGYAMEWVKGELRPIEPRRPCLSCNGTGWKLSPPKGRDDERRLARPVR